ncbi:cell wall-active antibiotics response protein LiaF [Radiobacillus kanasensis]|uniref:cell wall-active antibiotics response protein LiaF n=1 Tax=Radiobacillus kanasensis TaxID=2844358 RepID=UPI001E5AE977|nr:cell wall-active antibiotics response protein LiaF [Radiobacillus kanasensis]UFT98624.1 cell wall-active antibiotics response protein LiaF [Radiobacillus kanasensis]
MRQKKSFNVVDILLILTAVIFVFEFVLYGPGLLILVGVLTFGIYLGKKNFEKMWGKVLFWSAVLLILITIMDTLAFKFLALSILTYFLYKLYKSRQEPYHFRPEFDQVINQDDTIQRIQTLFTNKWFGSQHTTNSAYEWTDVNIQSGIGDTVIDLSYTMIPKDPPVISIRNIAGTVQILVPYDVEVSVQHSVLFGSLRIFNYAEQNMWNKVVHFKTEQFDESNQKVKIFTSTIIGKIEVKRV